MIQVSFSEHKNQLKLNQLKINSIALAKFVMRKADAAQPILYCQLMNGSEIPLPL